MDVKKNLKAQIEYRVLQRATCIHTMYYYYFFFKRKRKSMIEFGRGVKVKHAMVESQRATLA